MFLLHSYLLKRRIFCFTTKQLYRMNSISNLFIFDFDETLSIRSSNYPIEELAPNQNKLNLADIDNRYINEHRCWNIRMNELFEQLAEQGIKTRELMETFHKIELSPGVHELFHDITLNNGKIVIMSNACDLAIEQCLRAQGLLEHVFKIESNPVREIEPIIKIDEYEKPLQTICQSCDPNICKGLIIDRYRKEYSIQRIIFTGDGDNDVCPALRLNKHDLVFAKYDDEKSLTLYPMYNLLKTKYVDKLKPKLFVWKTMNNIREILKRENIL